MALEQRLPREDLLPGEAPGLFPCDGRRYGVSLGHNAGAIAYPRISAFPNPHFTSPVDK